MDVVPQMGVSDEAVVVATADRSSSLRRTLWIRKMSER